MPNFFLAAKGPDGSAAVARRQACYDGALGARGIHSLQSYGQVDLTHDTNAYTISSIYHDGTLKMYTSHPIQPTSRGRRPEYVMHQLKGWSMTSDFETFRKGATYYRNGQDWAMEQRDEAIRRANERVDEHHIGALAIGAGIIQASSFVSESTRDEIYIIETLSEESRTLVAEDFNTTTPLQESEVSSDELMVDLKAPFQRSVMHSSGLLQSRRKRRNAGNSDYDLTQRSERLLSKHSRLS